MDRENLEKAYEQALAELAKAKLEVEMLTNTVNGGTARLAVDDGMRIIAASEGYYRMTGYTEEESFDPPFFRRGVNLVLPQDLSVITSAIKKLSRDEPIQISYRIRKKNGTVAWNFAHCSRINQSGPERTIDVFFFDITDTKQTEIELKNLLDNIPAGVLRASVGDGIHVLFANQEFYRQTGYAQTEFAGKDIDNQYLRVVHPEDRDHLLERARAFTESQYRCMGIEYRIITKDGQLRWMWATGSRLSDLNEPASVLQGIIKDITDERQQRLDVALNEERYRIISEQTKETVFDWDLVQDRIQFSPVYQKMFGFMPPADLPVRSLTDYDIIYEEDKPQVTRMIDSILNGASYAEAEYRAKCADGSYLWCRNRVTTIFGDNHRPVRAIGLLSDINDYKQTATVLQNQAMRDSLTGLLNRMAFQHSVERILQEYPSGSHAFLLFDVDQFKSINDTMGHALGDEVLKNIASILADELRSSDLFARMGGDEFAVFMVNIASAEATLKIAHRLRARIGELAGLTGLKNQTTISLGMSAYPADASTFEELYKRADRALYEVKHKGGNGCLRYF
ncbi:sensor domain-containing diguanylate cyclase [Diplocloster agilis]|uniref:Diguanylate cyclase n=1 Tax=Diplocloster agilis TaxID=2850323 RepID=A0A949NH94_9FIRM|nr:sensor domain-containing diguanylate cyclase [Diplocloster agilis]MBU9735840.1 diguanylate cyclase [Diplocloster agilis]